MGIGGALKVAASVHLLPRRGATLGDIGTLTKNVSSFLVFFSSAIFES